MVGIIVPQEIIQNKIFLIRGKRVMFDNDLAKLYGVQTFRLNEAVKRNRKRFPEDFMFRLTQKEYQNLTSQIGVGLIKSVDDACRCNLISFVTGSVLSSIVEVLGGLKRNGSAVIDPG